MVHCPDQPRVAHPHGGKARDEPPEGEAAVEQGDAEGRRDGVEAPGPDQKAAPPQAHGGLQAAVQEEGEQTWRHARQPEKAAQGEGAGLESALRRLALIPAWLTSRLPNGSTCSDGSE